MLRQNYLGNPSWCPPRTKGSFYYQFKTSIKLESYLTSVKNRTHRVPYIKFHPSDHPFNVEKLRHVKFKIACEQRTCSLCCNRIEDEIYFSFNSKKFETQHKLFDRDTRSITGIKYWDQLSNSEKLILLFSNEKDTACQALAISV